MISLFKHIHEFLRWSTLCLLVYSVNEHHLYPSWTATETTYPAATSAATWSTHSNEYDLLYRLGAPRRGPPGTVNIAYSDPFQLKVGIRVCNTHNSRGRTIFNARFFRMHPQKLCGCIRQVLGFSRGQPRSVGVLQIREILSGA